MDPEIRTAYNWYRWLWLSPLLTIPTLISLLFTFGMVSFSLVCADADWEDCNLALAGYVGSAASFLGSAVWHLVLLIPAAQGQSAFVRWHGRQALLLAGLRTAVPQAFLLYDYQDGSYGAAQLFALPVLVVIWLFGTQWGQGQAARGDCALMRWAGRGAGLPLPVAAGQPAQPAGARQIEAARPDFREAGLGGQSVMEQGQAAEAARMLQQNPLPDAPAAPIVQAASQLEGVGAPAASAAVDALVDIVRNSRDSARRAEAVAELERLGLVEAL